MINPGHKPDSWTDVGDGYAKFVHHGVTGSQILEVGGHVYSVEHNLVIGRGSCIHRDDIECALLVLVKPLCLL